MTPKIGDTVTICYWEKSFAYSLKGYGGWKDDNYQEDQAVLQEPWECMKDRHNPSSARPVKNAVFRVGGNHFDRNGICIENQENEDPWIYWIKEMEREHRSNIGYSQQLGSSQSFRG